MTAAPNFRLDPAKRVLFLTKDPDLIRRQLRGELDLRMADIDVGDLLDDINTDTMTPAWVSSRGRTCTSNSRRVCWGERTIKESLMAKSYAARPRSERGWGTSRTSRPSPMRMRSGKLFCTTPKRSR